MMADDATTQEGFEAQCQDIQKLIKKMTIVSCFF